MHSPLHALQGAQRPAPARNTGPGRRVLVVGGGGPLGSAVLERLLGSGQWAGVAVLVSQPLEVAVTGLSAWPSAWVDSAQPMASPDGRALSQPPQPPDPPDLPDTAVLVFDREGSRHRREAALYRPDPARLPDLARGLLALGVQRLVLVLPHAPGLLPQALRAGLASLDEQAVAALGFSHLVLVRSAHLPGTPAGGGPRGVLPRVAGAVLSQLALMVPQRQQALRPSRVAGFVGDLALALPQAAPGTRVVAPELLWDWAAPGGGPAVLNAWLAGHAAPATRLPVAPL